MTLSADTKTGAAPDFMKFLDPSLTTTLDVRADLANGKDPFQRIMETIATMPPHNFLLIINTFKPTPLITILSKKGFEHHTEVKEAGVVYTYLRNTEPAKIEVVSPKINDDAVEFTSALTDFGDRIITIDVRSLEMPLPMVTILKELETLPEKTALYVHHKKVPQFLLPELTELGFTWHIHEIAEGDVKLLICR